MIKVKRRIQIEQPVRVKKPTDEHQERGRVPRVSKLMALAIRFDALIRDGVVKDQTELAQLCHVSQPRITQIMNLLHLAPDIQEAMLFMPRVIEGKDPVTEKQMRPIAAEVDWGRQRIEFSKFGKTD